MIVIKETSHLTPTITTKYYNYLFYDQQHRIYTTKNRQWLQYRQDGRVELKLQYRHDDDDDEIAYFTVR